MRIDLIKSCEPHPVCKVPEFGEFVTELPLRVWEAATGFVAAHPWRLAALLAAVSVVYAAVRVTYRRQQRAAAFTHGAFTRIVPPRAVRVERADHAWNVLSGIAARAWSRRWLPPWRLFPLPLAFEIRAEGDGRLTVGLWRPDWVPASAVAAAVGKAWPGARVEETAPPNPHAIPGARWSGWWLAPARGGPR
jgi:hypothetical protein